MVQKNTKLALAALAGLGGVVALDGQSRAAVIVINEVSGGGGGSGAAAYKQDFVELYNTGAVPLSLDGYLLQYAASGAASIFGNPIYNFGTGSVIGANDYLLINVGTVGTGGANNPTPNGTGFSTTNLSASSGSVRLLDAAGGTVDLVGYGTIATSTTNPPTVKVEGSGAAPTESITLSDSRTNFVDTDDNKADFTAGAPSPTAGITSVAVAAVPEPASAALLAVAAGSLAVKRRRRQV